MPETKMRISLRFTGTAGEVCYLRFLCFCFISASSTVVDLYTDLDIVYNQPRSASDAAGFNLRVWRCRSPLAAFTDRHQFVKQGRSSSVMARCSCIRASTAASETSRSFHKPVLSHMLSTIGGGWDRKARAPSPLKIFLKIFFGQL